MKTSLKNQLQLGVLALFCLLFAASCTQREDAPVSADPQASADFFTDLPDQSGTRMTDTDVFASDADIRKRYVTFDEVSFQSAIARQSSINLQLFADAAIQVRTTEMTPGDEVNLWKGTVDSDPFSTVILSYVGNEVMGHIQANGHSYRITPLGEGQHVIAEVVQSELPREACGAGKRHDGPATGTFGAGGGDVQIVTEPSQKSTSNQIRVLVLLSNTSSCNNTAFNNMLKSNCEAILNDAWNSNYYTSGYTANVLIGCTSYQAVGEEFDADLDWLKTNGGVAMLRDMFQVDLVSMFVPNGDACGLGQTPYPVTSSTSSAAFTVVKFSCAFVNYSFPHEIGHNLGMYHDRYEENGGNASRCNYGYVYAYNGNSGRSLMSYDTWCDDNGGNCDRVNVHSMAATHNGKKLGIACGKGITGINGSANNLSQLNAAAPIVAAYR